jgi:Xaa-Pro aminopeptidase
MEAAEFGVELAEIELPDYELPRDEPVVPQATYEARLLSVERAAAESELDALIVYGDREHFANIAYLTKFEPRFEEALLILVPGRRPRLVVGNECEAYAAISPVDLDVVRYQSFSLVSQPRSESPTLETVLRDAGLDGKKTHCVGVAGWKYFTTREFDQPERRLDAPAFIVDELRGMGCTPTNVTQLFSEPGRGIRLVNDADQLAYFEFAASHGSEAMRRLIFGIAPGMTEFEAFSLYQPIGLPFSYHPLLLSGERTVLGLASSSSRELRRGDPMSAGFGYWGSNIARSGFLVEDSEDLDEGIRDYIGRLVAPYFAAAVEWYETVGIGVTGGELYDVVKRRLGAPFFGVHLNPGHFIHLDEWPSSPVYEGSSIELQSGMALQLDVIPATGTDYHTSNIEDGVALASEPTREELSERFPGLWSRVERRRSFMREELGINLKPEVLPLSGLAGYLPPFWLAPKRALRCIRNG